MLIVSVWVEYLVMCMDAGIYVCLYGVVVIGRVCECVGVHGLEWM